MLKTILYVSLTADGRVARAEDTGGVPPVVLADLMGLVARHGAMVIGRRTYELFRDLGAIETIPGRIVVISRSLGSAPGVMVAGSPEAGLQKLADSGQAAAVLCGGVETYDSFLRMGAVDDVRLNIVPALMGRGPRLADWDQPLGLAFVEAAPLGDGIVQLRYGRLDPQP